VVAVGLTDFDVCPVTLPTLLSIVSDVAPVTEKESVLDCPLVIDAGLAVKLLMTGAAAGVSVTVAVAVLDVSALLIALIVIVCTLLILAGAV
jgi:hypothetical protein